MLCVWVLDKRRSTNNLAQLRRIARSGLVHSLQCNKSQKNKQPKSKQRNRQPRTRPALIRQHAQVGNHAKIARMIADPCNAPIVEGQYGSVSGYVNRFKSVAFPSEATTCGYILFCPYSVGTGAQNNPITILYFAPSGPNTAIINTVGEPMGTSATTSGIVVEQPGAAFLTGPTCAKSRNLAACMRVTYTGTTSTCQGRLAYLENINTEQILNRPTVNQLFALSSKTSRIGLDPMEVTYRVDEMADSRFKPAGVGALTRGLTGAAISFESGSSLDLSPKWFGFAWNGVPCNQLVFEFYDIREWEPDTNTGFVNGVTTSTNDGKPVVGAAIALLDKQHPTWSTTLMGEARSLMNKLSDAALAGAGALAKEGLRHIFL